APLRTALKRALSRELCAFCVRLLSTSVLSARGVELPRDFASEMIRRHDAREGPETQDPASQRGIETDLQHHPHRSVFPGADFLRGMPAARGDVLGDGWLEGDLHTLGRPRM